MKQVITNGQLAALLNHILTNPFSGEVDDQSAFEQFCTDIAQIVCKHCGGKVTAPASYAPEPSNMDWATHYKLEVQINDSSPEDGGVWAGHAIRSDAGARAVITKLVKVLHPGAVGLIHNEHGEERGTAACEAVTAAKVYLGRGRETEVLSGYFNFEGATLRADFAVPVGATTEEKDAAFMAALAQQADIDYLSIGNIQAQQQQKRDIFRQAFLAKVVMSSNTDWEPLQARRDLLAQEVLAQYPGETLLSRELYDTDHLLGSCLAAINSLFVFPDWEGRTVSDFQLRHGIPGEPLCMNVIQLSSPDYNQEGRRVSNVTLQELWDATTLGEGGWLLPSGLEVWFAEKLPCNS